MEVGMGLVGKNGSEDPFAFFDFTETEVEEEMERVTAAAKARGTVCMCGHPSGRHTEEVGVYSCSAGKYTCPCKKLKPVIEVDNARIFLRKTTGPGTQHALAQGMLSAIKAGQEISWLIEQKCDKCDVPGAVAPCPVNQRGVVMDEATGYDVLLCRDCR
jgi:hypothetical protein